MQLKRGSHVHLIGICGTAMASLAGLLKDLGYKVTGSDQNVYPPMSTQLQSLGIQIQQGYRAENLQPRPDLVIVGNVISKSNIEAHALLASDIPYTSLPKAMGEFVIGNRHSLVVAGTHGKTTTTSMLSWIADSCGFRPGFLIGGIPLNYSQSFRKPVKDIFVIEGDEYDTAFFDKVPKFIHYKPRSVILTSVEFDHADIYKNLEDVKSAFKMLLKLIPKDGLLVAMADDQNIASILSEAHCRVVTYGLSHGDYQVTDRVSLTGRNHFCVVKNGQKVADLAIKQFGVHNTLNALAAYVLATELGWPQHLILQGLATFQGVKRRQEVIGEVNNITVVEDFAHHPTAVELTIGCMREKYPERRIVAVFEPRSATSRRNVFQQDFAKALAKADICLLAEPFDQSKIAEGERFSSQKVVEFIKSQGGSAFLGKDTNALVDKLSELSKPGDVILIMSNGGFDGIYQKLLGQL